MAEVPAASVTSPTQTELEQGVLVGIQAAVDNGSEKLDLSERAVSSLPEVFGKLSVIKEIDLSSNNLEVRIP